MANSTHTGYTEVNKNKKKSASNLSNEFVRTDGRVWAKKDDKEQNAVECHDYRSVFYR